MNTSITYCWPLALLIIGLMMIGGGVKVIVDKKVTYTKRIGPFKGIRLIRAGRSAVIGGVSFIFSGLLIVAWAIIEFSGEEFETFQRAILCSLIWLVQVIGIGVGEIIHRNERNW